MVPTPNDSGDSKADIGIAMRSYNKKEISNKFHSTKRRDVGSKTSTSRRLRRSEPVSTLFAKSFSNLIFANTSKLKRAELVAIDCPAILLACDQHSANCKAIRRGRGADPGSVPVLTARSLSTTTRVTFCAPDRSTATPSSDSSDPSVEKTSSLPPLRANAPVSPVNASTLRCGMWGAIFLGLPSPSAEAASPSPPQNATPQPVGGRGAERPGARGT
mmetsp:Transcript_14351/g.41219  ORF Transcript_14351/g.41219 Transcript_14351/m.41219 type:complete len:217 (+) Transcript_14351:1643-2293(+)